MSESIPTFPVLYKINKNGAATSWNIEIVPSASAYIVRTSHGSLQGKMNTHEHVIERGLAGRSILEQAAQFTRRKWTDKKEKEQFSEELVEPSLTAHVEVRPMLAKTWDKTKYGVGIGGRSYRIPFPAFVQRKLDGLRCLAYRGVDGKVVLESRKGTGFVHFEAIREEVSRMLVNLPATFHFDGELFTKELPFETLSGLIRLKRTLEPADQEALQKVEFHIYDFVDTARLGLTFAERIGELRSIFAIHGTARCRLVETLQVGSVEEVQGWHDRFVLEGEEGIMIRAAAGVYEVGRRSAFLQKYKEFEEEEFRIVGFHEGTGDEAGLVVWDCTTAEGKGFAVRPRGSFAFRRQLFLEAANYVGRNLSVVFQERSLDGVPRFPVGKAIREDL
jgi:hypothetical protein